MTGGRRAGVPRRGGGRERGTAAERVRATVGFRAAVVLACLLAWAGVVALPAGPVAAQEADGAAAGHGDEGAARGGDVGDCDPAEMICIDVFEDDPDAVTAHWDGAAKVWVVEPPTGHVRVRHEGDTVTARRLQLREEDEYARLEEDVVVVREDLEGRSLALDLWWEREEYLFTGDVELVQFEEGEPTRTLWADEVRYFSEGDRVIATGNVRMEDDSYRVWAQEMTYRKEPEETMTFTGRVRVQSLDPESEWTISGERFEYDVEAEQGRIIGPHRIEVTPRD